MSEETMIEAEGEGLGGGSPGRAGLAGVCAGREISPQNSRSWMEVEVLPMRLFQSIPTQPHLNVLLL